MKNNRSFTFNSIYVIEFLLDTDSKTGKDLYNNCIFPLVAQQKKLLTQLYQATTKVDFIKYLKLIIQECKVNNRVPILHIETHGIKLDNDTVGIGTSTTDYISWAELKQYLCLLNEITRLNLLVVMAACNGMDLAKVLRVEDRAPVWAIIGPSIEVNSTHLLNGFTAFYIAFFNKPDGRFALDALNNRNPNGNPWDFKFLDAEFFFKVIYKKYIEKYCTEMALIERSKKLAKKLLADGHITPNMEKEKINEFYALYKEEQPGIFEHHKNNFFMMDSFKENQKRFQITLEQCINFLKE